MTTPALKYSVQDRSILLPHYKRFFVEPTLPFIPAKVNPNAITHVGHLINLVALVILVGAAPQMTSGWPYFVVAILVQFYLWADNADGGHARRTNQCSAKGEFLDHGLDLLNATYVVCMTVVTIGAPSFWSVTASVMVTAAAAVTYWEQAETGTFQLGMLNQIESIFCLTIALCIRGLFGLHVISDVTIVGFALPVLILVFVTSVALFGIFRSAMRVAKKRGRLMPFIAPFTFGCAVAAVAWTNALGTLAAIVVGATVFVFMGIGQLTMRVRGARPILERGLLLAAAMLGGLTLYRVYGGDSAAAFSKSIDWATATIVSIAFGGPALIRALAGHREVERLDAAKSQ